MDNSIKYINSLLINKRVSASALFPKTLFILLKTGEIKEYVDGKPTDKVLAYAYEVVDMTNFDHVRVRIDSTKPLISNEDLQNRRNTGETFYVEFEDLTVMAYVSSSQCLVDSFKAKDIHLVETSE